MISTLCSFFVYSCFAVFRSNQSQIVSCSNMGLVSGSLLLAQLTDCITQESAHAFANCADTLDLGIAQAAAAVGIGTGIAIAAKETHPQPKKQDCQV